MVTVYMDGQEVGQFRHMELTRTNPTPIFELGSLRPQAFVPRRSVSVGLQEGFVRGQVQELLDPLDITVTYPRENGELATMSFEDVMVLQFEEHYPSPNGIVTLNDLHFVGRPCEKKHIPISNEEALYLLKKVGQW